MEYWNWNFELVEYVNIKHIKLISCFDITKQTISSNDLKVIIYFI